MFGADILAPQCWYLLYWKEFSKKKQAVWEAAAICARPSVTFDLEIGVRFMCDVGYLCAEILVFLGLSVLDLGPMYMTDRQTSDNIIA